MRRKPTTPLLHKVLVLGSGGREHALAWKTRESHWVEDVFVHPGNAGILGDGFKNLHLSTLSPSAVAKAAKESGISLIVIGPETFLDQGYADHLREKGFLVVGPNKAAAKLESSKIFAKEILSFGHIPTAKYQVFENQAQLVKWCETSFHPPAVLKYDGLAAGKGVVVCQTQAEALRFGEQIWKENVFGKNDHHRLLREDFLPGKEMSYIGLCDGDRFVPLATATDYKRLSDGNQGPNTGGMGSVSPSPFVTAELESKIQKKIVAPLLKTLKAKHLDYRGALFLGLMIDDKGDPSVVEINARFGDPETQATLLRLESDFFELLGHTANGTLSKSTAPHWKTEPSVYVVGAALGYPESPRKGDAITGIKLASHHVHIFYSGVKAKARGLVTDGGRVLGLGAVGESIEVARKRVYAEFSHVHWKGQHLRSDIGLVD